MEVQRTVDPNARVVTLTVTGDLSDPDLLRLADDLEGSPDVAVDFSLLIDLRGAHGRKITTSGVYRLVERALVLAPTSRRAVVVRSMVGFGMARMYEMLRTNRGGRPRVFLNYEEARRWVSGAR